MNKIIRQALILATLCPDTGYALLDSGGLFQGNPYAGIRRRDRLSVPDSGKRECGAFIHDAGGSGPSPGRTHPESRGFHD